MPTHKLEFIPAFDKRDPDPTKNYGIHGMEMVWTYGEPQTGIVVFRLFTNWHLPHVASELGKKEPELVGDEWYWMLRPMPADLGFHWTSPRYAGQESLTHACEFLGGRKCYYDGSSLNAMSVFNDLVSKGGRAVEEYLEEYYNDLLQRTT